MHIGFITSEYSNPKFENKIGGIGTFTKNLAENLVRSGCKVTVFIHSQKEEFRTSDNGVILHFVKRKSKKALTWYYNRKYFNNYVSLVVKRDKIDILEAPDWTGFTAFMKFTIPLIIRLHGSDTFFCDLEQRKLKRKNAFFEAKALKSSTAIVGVSNFVSSKTKELFKLKETPSVIYNAIDLKKFKPNHKSIKENSLLYFGTMIRKKGVLELANIFNELVKLKPNISLTILGKDVVDLKENKSTLELFKQQLSHLALNNFCYFDSVPYQEVQNHIKEAEIVVLPSLAESFGLVTIEAMSLEKSVVTSNFEWNQEIIENNVSGIMENPMCHADYAKKILWLINHKQKSIEMGVNARRRVFEKFNLDKITEMNISFYKKYINS